MMKDKKQENQEKESSNINPEHDPDTHLINQQLRNHVLTLQEKNAGLKNALERTKEEIDAIKEEVKKLKSPPLPYGTFVRPSENPELIVISVEGRLMEVNVANKDIEIDKLEAGQFLLLNPGYNVIELRSPQEVGEIGKVVDLIEGNRIIVKSHESDEVVMNVADTLADRKLRVGDNIRYDRGSLMAYEIMPKSEVEDVVLEEIPDVTYDDIGGLEDQLEQIKDAIELPYIYGYLYRQYNLKPPKGILLYGPPGCGKTLVAKAVANSLSARIHATLRNIRDALEVLITLKQKNASYKDVAEKFEALRYEIYEYQAIYRYTHHEDDVEALYDKLDKSSVLGNFIRRTEGDRTSPRLVCNIDDWHDLLIELKELGYEKLHDKKRIGEMLEKKRKNYFIQREKVSDEDYAANWLEDFLTNSGINVKGDLEKELRITEEKLGGGVESYFLNIKGPELLNKYVGETEHKIREVFMKAREKAQRGLPVIVFFDEMESIFRTRGSGISSDVESTIVPQFLAEIDGVEKLDNVITIGASNRQDLIDPAVLRPGRLDVKIRIDRPDKEAARDIFSKYLTDDVPLSKEDFDEKMTKAEMLRELIHVAVEDMYSEKPENRFLKVTYRNREQEILYFRDFASGAMIEGIVSRAKTYAIKRTIISGGRGLRKEDLIEAIRDEYKENEDLPNTTNPDDWAKISGKKGEKIVGIETLLPKKQKEPKREAEEVTVSNRYL